MADPSWTPICGLGNCLAVCPDASRRTASVLLDTPHVQLVDLCGDVQRTLSTAEHRPCAQAWSADGGTLFVAARQPSHSADGSKRPAIVRALDANDAYAQLAACTLSFTPLALSATRADRAGACTVAVGGAPGLLVCSFARGELVPRFSFRTPGGPVCCASFDPTGRWLACVNMNGMLALARTSTLLRGGAVVGAPDAAPASPAGSWAAEAAAEPSTPARLAPAEPHLQFARRLPAAYGTMCEGVRPTGVAWAARGLRLLVCSWDGCVELLEAEPEGAGRAHALGASEPERAPAEDALRALAASGLGGCERARDGAGGGRGGDDRDGDDRDGGDGGEDAWEPRWQLRSVRASDGPIDPSACAPQLCWASSGLAACVTRSVAACHRTVTEAGWEGVAVAEVVLLPLAAWRARAAPQRPYALAASGGEPTVLARHWLREAVAGVGVGGRAARGARARGGGGGGGGCVLLISTSGRRLNKPLPLEAVLTPADVEALPLACSANESGSANESVCLRAPCAESARSHWSLRVVRAAPHVGAAGARGGDGGGAEADSPRAQRAAAESDGASGSRAAARGAGAEIQIAPSTGGADFQIELALAQLDWLDAVRLAARAAGALTPPLAPSRAGSQRDADDAAAPSGAAAARGAVAVSLSPTLLVVLRANCVYWHARRRRLLAPRAHADERELGGRTEPAGAWRAALLDERGAVGIWCLESSVCIAQLASRALAPAQLPAVFRMFADDEGDAGAGADADADAAEEAAGERADGAAHVAFLRRDLRLVLVGSGDGDGDGGDGDDGDGDGGCATALGAAAGETQHGSGFATLRALWLVVKASGAEALAPASAASASAWRDARAEPPCAPGAIAGVRGGSALAYWAMAADGSARRELHLVELGGASSAAGAP